MKYSVLDTEYDKVTKKTKYQIFFGNLLTNTIKINELKKLKDKMVWFNRLPITVDVKITDLRFSSTKDYPPETILMCYLKDNKILFNVKVQRDYWVDNDDSIKEAEKDLVKNIDEQLMRVEQISQLYFVAYQAMNGGKETLRFMKYLYSYTKEKDKCKLPKTPILDFDLKELKQHLLTTDFKEFANLIQEGQNARIGKASH